MRKDAVAVDRQQCAAVACAGKEPAIGSQPESVDNIFARSPQLFRSAVGVDAVDAAGKLRRKGQERWLQRTLDGTSYATGSDGRGSPWRAIGGPGGFRPPLLFTHPRS